MFRPRLIVVLLIGKRGLVKSAQFKDHIYVGDPVNAVRVFSNFGADELMVLDIEASREHRAIAPTMLSDISEEAKVPLSVGGGIRRLADIEQILSAGVEKVVLGSHAVLAPNFVRQAAMEYGSSAISVCIDVRNRGSDEYEVRSLNGLRTSGVDPFEFAATMEEMGAGEIVIQSIDRDGTMNGYDLKLINGIATKVSVPVVALGGAASMDDFNRASSVALASASAAGSAFVFFGPRGAVLLNYPPLEERTARC